MAKDLKVQVIILDLWNRRNNLNRIKINNRYNLLFVLLNKGYLICPCFFLQYFIYNAILHEGLSYKYYRLYYLMEGIAVINYIWFFILVIGLILGIATGRGDLLSKGIMGSSQNTVKLVIELVGSMCLWCGVMKIAQKSGLTDKLARALRPFLKLIFKDAARDEAALSAIVMNLTANMMGLSNAATPAGIKAMEELDRLNKRSESASNDMVLFLVLNAACIQIVPATVLSLRAAAKSQNPGVIIIPAIFATATAALVGIICSKILQKFF